MRAALLCHSRGVLATCFLLGLPPAAAAATPEAPRWTLSLEAIMLERSSGTNRTLVERVPGSVPFLTTLTTPGTEAFNSGDFNHGFAAGPRVRLSYRFDAAYGIEATYFNVFARSASTTTGPDSPADWLVMRAPGLFWQTQDFAYQGMTWTSETNLYSAEINARRTFAGGITLLAGVRWLQLNDKLVGTLSPPDLTAPTWKQTCKFCTISQITPGGTAGNYPPFWSTATTNNLFGIQFGAEGRLLEIGRLAFDGAIKAGLFDNIASQVTGVSLEKIVYPASSTANRLAFAAEAGVQLRYQLQERLVLKVGYEALWLAGVALAPAQIDETHTTATVSARGVDTGSNVLFQGFSFGVEYSF